MPLLLVLFSGLLGSLFGLGYKYKTRYGCDHDRLIVVLSGSATLFALACIPLFHEPLFDREALLLGLPFGVASYISTLLYLIVIERAQLNVSWTVIQFFVVIPFLISVIGYGERLDLVSVLGIVLIFASIVLFGQRRRGSHEGAIKDRRLLVMLLLSTLFSGIGNSIPKIYTASVSQSNPFALLFWANLWYLASALVVAGYKGRLGKLRPTGATLGIGSWMGVTSVIGMAALTVALRTLGGAVAFPIRSVVNIIAVFLLSFALFRERVTVIESVGAATALAGVVLVSSSVS